MCTWTGPCLAFPQMYAHPNTHACPPAHTLSQPAGVPQELQDEATDRHVSPDQLVVAEYGRGTVRKSNDITRFPDPLEGGLPWKSPKAPILWTTLVNCTEHTHGERGGVGGGGARERKKVLVRALLYVVLHCQTFGDTQNTRQGIRASLCRSEELHTPLMRRPYGTTAARSSSVSSFSVLLDAGHCVATAEAILTDPRQPTPTHPHQETLPQGGNEINLRGWLPDPPSDTPTHIRRLSFRVD